MMQGYARLLHIKTDNDMSVYDDSAVLAVCSVVKFYLVNANQPIVCPIYRLTFLGLINHDFDLKFLSFRSTKFLPSGSTSRTSEVTRKLDLPLIL